MDKFKPAILGREAAAIESQFVTVGSSDGWKYADDSGIKAKWGWKSATVNATISFQLNPLTQQVNYAFQELVHWRC